MVAYTCRYFSGPLIPNSAIATDWNVGINCLLEYWQVSLVSLLYIYMIPIACKITNFSLYSRINYWNTHKPVWLVLSHDLSVHSNISKEQHEKHLCNPSSHYGKYLWNACPIFWYVKAMTSQFQQCQTHFIT